MNQLLPRWKIRRELKRLAVQAQSIPAAIYEPFLQKNYDKNFLENVTLHIGDLENKHAIIIDDMIDTAGTICNAAYTAINKGANSVFAMATHPVLSGPAVERLSNSKLSKVIVTDTISLDDSKVFEKLEKISVSDVFAQAIKHIVDGTSLSSMFKL